MYTMYHTVVFNYNLATSLLLTGDNEWLLRMSHSAASFVWAYCSTCLEIKMRQMALEWLFLHLNIELFC